jgi:outer membrane protein assembly factor BamB
MISPSALRTRLGTVATVAALVAAATLGSAPVARAVPGPLATGVYAPSGWPTIHADARNSDTSPVTGSATMVQGWTTTVGGTTPAYASIAPDGTVYVTSNRAVGCHLIALDGVTGAPRCLSVSPLYQPGPYAFASTPLIDVDGHVYVGDAQYLWSFTRAGAFRWRMPIEGVPLSAQFTGDGHVLVVTHIGNVYVFDRSSGARTIFHQLVPGARFVPGDLSFLDCLEGGPRCAVANTPAVDLTSGLITLTFRPAAAGSALLLGLRYVGGAAPRIDRLWQNDALTNGSASSPDISADGTRIYVNDNGGHLWAADAADGHGIWSYSLGFNATGSPSTSSDGVIIPSAGTPVGSTGGAVGGPLLGLADRGDHADLLWRRDDLQHVGVPAQAAGGFGYAFVTFPGSSTVNLLAFDTACGRTLSTVAVPGSASVVTVGTSIGPRGEVVTPGFLGTIYSFHPAPTGG